MMRSISQTSLRQETVFWASLSLTLLLSSANAYGVTACSLEPNTYDPAQFDRVLENFEQTTTLRLEGTDWDNTLVRNCKVHDTGADGIFLKNVRNVVVQNCEVWNTGNTGRGITLSSWGGARKTLP